MMLASGYEFVSIHSYFQQWPQWRDSLWKGQWRKRTTYGRKLVLTYEDFHDIRDHSGRITNHEGQNHHHGGPGVLAVALLVLGLIEAARPSYSRRRRYTADCAAADAGIFDNSRTGNGRPSSKKAPGPAGRPGNAPWGTVGLPVPLISHCAINANVHGYQWD